MRSNVAIVFGGPSPEHDISILTGLQCERLLSAGGSTVVPIYWDRASRWHQVPAGTEARDYLEGPPAGSQALELRLDEGGGWFRSGGLRKAKVTVDEVLNCFHGGFGEGGGAQALFSALGIPATGGSMQASALGMDKLAFGGLMRSAGLPTLDRQLLTREDADQLTVEWPAIVKPRFGGSSIGIEVVGDLATALALAETNVHLRGGAVIEPFRADLFDLNVAYRTFPTFQVSLIERPQRDKPNTIYSYEDKYLSGSGLVNAPRELPAQIDSELEDQIRELTGAIARLTDLAGVVRVDFLSDGKQVFVNEVNGIPGAMGLYLWQGVDAAQILLDALEEAATTFARTPPPPTGDGTALLVAAGIAKKLTGLSRSRQPGSDA